MTNRFILESFDSPGAAPASPVAPAAPAATSVETAEDIEARLSASYEKGFRAGWDDCLVARDQDQTRIAEAFGRRLGEVTINTETMRRAILAEFEPLFQDILQKILPSLVQRSFLPRLLEEIRAIAEASPKAPIEVAVSAEDALALETLLNAQPDLPACQVVSDPVLGLSQATLRFGEAEQQFDLGGLLDAIEEAFADFAATSNDTRSTDFDEVSNA